MRCSAPLAIFAGLKRALPDMFIHKFSPLDIDLTFIFPFARATNAKFMCLTRLEAC